MAVYLNGIKSNELTLIVGEKMAKSIDFAENLGDKIGLKYGESIQLDVVMTPKNLINKNFQFIIISGEENITINPYTGILTVDYMANPSIETKIQVIKIINYSTGEYVESRIFEIIILTTEINEFYILPNLFGLFEEGEEYQLDYSFDSKEVKKETTDYIYEYEFFILLGEEFATITSYGLLSIGKNITIYDAEIWIVCILYTSNGEKESDLFLRINSGSIEIEIIGENEVKTSESISLDINVRIRSLDYLLDFYIIQGNEYGKITEDGILTVFDYDSVGKIIIVQAAVLLFIDDEIIENISKKFEVKILIKAVEEVNITANTQKEGLNFIAEQGAMIAIDSSVSPKTATRKNVDYRLDDYTNATITSTGMLTIKETATIGTIIEIIAESDSVTKSIFVKVLKAKLKGFEIGYDKEQKYSSGSEIELYVKNMAPTFYDIREIKHEIEQISGKRKLAEVNGNNIIIVNNLQRGETTIRILSTIDGIEFRTEIELVIITWLGDLANEGDYSVDRGQTFVINAGVYGDNNWTFGNVEYFLFDNNNDLVSSTNNAKIIETSKINVFDWVDCNDIIVVVAKYENLFITKKVLIKKVKEIHFYTDDEKYAGGYSKENGTTVASLLYPDSSITGKNEEYLDLKIKAKLESEAVGTAKVSNDDINFRIADTSKLYDNSKTANGRILDNRQFEFIDKDNLHYNGWVLIEAEYEGKITQLKIYVFIPPVDRSTAIPISFKTDHESVDIYEDTKYFAPNVILNLDNKYASIQWPKGVQRIKSTNRPHYVGYSKYINSMDSKTGFMTLNKNNTKGVLDVIHTHAIISNFHRGRKYFDQEFNYMQKLVLSYRLTSSEDFNNKINDLKGGTTHITSFALMDNLVLNNWVAKPFPNARLYGNGKTLKYSTNSDNGLPYQYGSSSGADRDLYFAGLFSTVTNSLISNLKIDVTMNFVKISNQTDRMQIFAGGLAGEIRGANTMIKDIQVYVADMNIRIAERTNSTNHAYGEIKLGGLAGSMTHGTVKNVKINGKYTRKNEYIAERNHSLATTGFFSEYVSNVDDLIGHGVGNFWASAAKVIAGGLIGHVEFRNSQRIQGNTIGLSFVVKGSSQGKVGHGFVYISNLVGLSYTGGGITYEGNVFKEVSTSVVNTAAGMERRIGSDYNIHWA